MRPDEWIMIIAAVSAMTFVLGVVAGTFAPNPSTDRGDIDLAIDRLIEAESNYRKHVKHFSQDHEGTARALEELRAAIATVRRVAQSLVLT